MATRGSNAYALLGIVGFVALIAILLVLWGTGFTLPGANLLGRTTLAPPTYNGEPIVEAKAGEVVYQGPYVKVTLVETTRVHAIIVRETQGILEEPLQETPAEGEIAVDDGPIAVEPIIGPPYWAEKNRLRVGDSTDLFGNTVITLVTLEDGVAGFVIVEGAQACGSKPGQGPFCRGGAACCGGACVELPDCTTVKRDGPITSCGERTLYCCNGKLTGVACDNGDEYPKVEITSVKVEGAGVSVNGVAYPACGGIDEKWCAQENPGAIGDGPFEFKWGDGSASCSWFPAEHMYEPPIPYSIAVRVKNTCGFISERVATLPGAECTKDLDCPQIVCVQAPCPQSVCVDGRCVQEPVLPCPMIAVSDEFCPDGIVDYIIDDNGCPVEPVCVVAGEEVA